MTSGAGTGAAKATGRRHRSSTGTRRSRLIGRDRWAALLLAALIVYLIASLVRIAVNGHPLSMIDEHVHLDTQFKVHHGTYPHRGSLYGRDLINEWACGVGHEAGPLSKPCGDPTLGPADLPSGKYTPGYIHYPTYFLGGETFRRLVDSVAGPRDPLDLYRSFAALVMGLGVIICGVISWRLRLRGLALVAGTLVPVAAASILMYGTIVNPTSTAVLTGALVAGAGLRWTLTGRGYGWLLGASAVAACVAVTDSIPAGGFLIAIVAALVLRRRGYALDTPWRPRWWHAALLAGVLVVPILIWGRVISSQATVPNSTLYGAYGFDSWTPVLAHTIRELFSIHSPWNGAITLETTAAHPVALLVRGFGYGIPLWITVLVFATLILGALGTLTRPSTADESRQESVDGRKRLSTLRVLTASALAGVVLYPPALQLSNAVNEGINNGIVDRYSISFAPLLVWLALLTTRDRPVIGRILGALGALCVVAVAATAW